MGTARNYPGMTRFQKSVAGTTQSGWSGIVPFYRTKSGEIKAPINPGKPNIFGHR